MHNPQPHTCPWKGYTRCVQASMAFFRMGVLSESGGSALMSSWVRGGTWLRLWGPELFPGATPKACAHPGLTIICATSSAFREKWKEPACALLVMAWLTMHTLCTRHSFRVGSCRDTGLRKCFPGAALAWPGALNPFNPVAAAHSPRYPSASPAAAVSAAGPQQA